jgi:NifU-like protein involved in Fe-S cluster formation
MDPEIIQYYRRLLREGFAHAGSCENPEIFLDSVGENIPICAQIGTDYLHLYISVKDKTITNIQYLCTCDPAANVVIEVLCDLVKGKTLEEAKALTEEAFYQVIGCRSEEVQKKVKGILKLLNRGIARYENPESAPALDPQSSPLKK